MGREREERGEGRRRWEGGKVKPMDVEGLGGIGGIGGIGGLLLSPDPLG